MRIISGIYKGKAILYLKSTITRPLKDSVKENIFNIIEHSNLLNINLQNSNILDLYSGVGSFGLECISRGAAKITFVEKDKKALEILSKNLTNLRIKKNSTIINNDVINFLDKDCFESFDIIFFDPPFAENSYIKELKMMKKMKIFTKNHIIVIHREKKSLDDFSQIIKPIIVKYYGRSKIIFGKILN
jgi:16S rRNA (guanine966-N2)-methyltransferase